MNYKFTAEFEKDFKRLLKRFKTLEEDFETLKKYHIELFHNKNIPGPLLIPGFCTNTMQSYKVKKFASRSLKNRGSNSGLRVIYVFNRELDEITFIEIYFKGDQENEDKIRLKKWISFQN